MENEVIPVLRIVVRQLNPGCQLDFIRASTCLNSQRPRRRSEHCPISPHQAIISRHGLYSIHTIDSLECTNNNNKKRNHDPNHISFSSFMVVLHLQHFIIGYVVVVVHTTWMEWDVCGSTNRKSHGRLVYQFSDGL